MQWLASISPLDASLGFGQILALSQTAVSKPLLYPQN
jgi:hypothetical protein